MRSLKIIFTCTAPILLIPCMDLSKTPTSGFVDHVSLPKPLTAKATLFTDNNLIIEISRVIDRQGYVYAEYWLGSTLGGELELLKRMAKIIRSMMFGYALKPIIVSRFLGPIWLVIFLTGLWEPLVLVIFH